MSIEKVKKLEDLKEKAAQINAERYALLKPKIPLALKSVIVEMANYLKSQGFSITYSVTSVSGFRAQYKEIDISVMASGDELDLIGADYDITLHYGQKKLVVRLMVNRGKSVRAPISRELDGQIDDYEKRYIPELEALGNSELDGSYELYMNVKNQSGIQTIYFVDGKAVVDKLFE